VRDVDVGHLDERRQSLAIVPPERRGQLVEVRAQLGSLVERSLVEPVRRDVGELSFRCGVF